jgi:hypothetical protein
MDYKHVVSGLPGHHGPISEDLVGPTWQTKRRATTKPFHEKMLTSQWQFHPRMSGPWPVAMRKTGLGVLPTDIVDAKYPLMK